MGTLKIMDGSGDTAVQWEVNNRTQVERASDLFNQMVGGMHYSAYGAKPGQDLEEIQEFDRTLEKVVLVPQMAGG